MSLGCVAATSVYELGGRCKSASRTRADRRELAMIPCELSPHSLRRTFASLLYLHGANPVYVMHRSGHTDPRLALRIYTRVMGRSGAEALARGL